MLRFTPVPMGLIGDVKSVATNPTSDEQQNTKMHWRGS